MNKWLESLPQARLSPTTLWLPSSTCPTHPCLSALPWQRRFHSENHHSREISHHVALEAPTYPAFVFIAESTESSEAAEGGIYFGPKQKRVGDSVGRDGNSWTWCGWLMPGSAQNFLCFVGVWGRRGPTEVSLKHYQMQEWQLQLSFEGRGSTEGEQQDSENWRLKGLDGP